MGRVSASQDVRGPLGGAERLWYDTTRWPSFVDGFGHRAKQEGPWPQTGARIVWDSTPAGRGRVIERVTAHEPGVGQELAVEDPRLNGTQRVRFEALEDGVAVSVELEYELKQAGPLTPLVDVLFIRRALRDSLRRTLRRFSHEVAADLELLR
jgi:hypothetical protein